MSGALVPSLTATEARTRTDMVKRAASELWSDLLALYEGGAHTALGYESWAAYCAAEFDVGRSHAYRLLDAGRVARLVAEPSIPNLGTESKDGGDCTASPRVGDWPEQPASPPVGDSPGQLVPPDWREQLRRELLGADDTRASDERPATPAEGGTASRARATALPPPSNESVARKLAKTAKADPRRAQEIWRRTVAAHGPDATAQQVAEIAGEIGPPSEGWETEARAFAKDVRRAAKTKDPQDARRALARWRAAVYPALDRIARGR